MKHPLFMQRPILFSREWSCYRLLVLADSLYETSMAFGSDVSWHSNLFDDSCDLIFNFVLPKTIKADFKPRYMHKTFILIKTLISFWNMCQLTTNGFCSWLIACRECICQSYSLASTEVYSVTVVSK